MEQNSAYSGKFCDPNELQISTIGTGYIANFISVGEAQRAGATLTNKRIYFTGKVFTLDGKGGLSSIKQRKIVNVRDVTGTGYILYNPLYLLICGIASFVLGLSEGYFGVKK